jgi:Barstar (barnase inhibitor)
MPHFDPRGLRRSASDEETEPLGLDYQLMQNGAVSLFWRRWVMERAIERLKRQGYRVLLVDAAKSAPVGKLLQAIAVQVPEWPEGYVSTLDGLADALSEMNFPVETGIVIAFVGYSEFERQSPQEARMVLDIIEGQSRFCLLFGLRLLGLVHVDDPDIDLGSLGGRRASWNGAEMWQRNRVPGSLPEEAWWLSDEG